MSYRRLWSSSFLCFPSRHFLHTHTHTHTYFIRCCFLFPLIAREWNKQCLHDALIICNDSPWVIPYCSCLIQQARSEQKHSLLGEEKSVCCNSLLTVSMVKAHTSPKFLFLYYQRSMTIFQSCYCCSEISVGTFDWLVEAFCQKEKQQSIVKLIYNVGRSRNLWLGQWKHSGVFVRPNRSADD
jgi:hypothetical protein